MRIGKHELEAPLMNAGGVVKSVEDVRQMARTAVGAIVAGSFTLKPRVGNSPNGEVVYWHDPQTGITTNSLGMPNKGLEAVAKDLPEMIDIAHDHGKPFVLNFAPVTNGPIEEVITMSEILQRAGVDTLDAIELNASCPNVALEGGKRHAILSHNPELFEDVASELSDIGANEVPFEHLIARISPFLSQDQIHAFVMSVERSGVDIVSAFNTFPGGKPLDPQGRPRLTEANDVAGIGGQSGPGMTSRAEEQTSWLIEARDQQNVSFELIGSNGIFDAATMKKRLNLGASAVSATTLFWEAKRNWGVAVDKVLSDFAEL